MDDACKKCIYYRTEQGDCINPRDENGENECKHFFDNEFQKFMAIEILQLGICDKFKEPEQFNHGFIRKRFRRIL